MLLHRCLRVLFFVVVVVAFMEFKYGYFLSRDAA